MVEIGALMRHAQAERSEIDRPARAADRAAHAAYRPCRHPQPRHASAARSPMPIRRRNCRPACWRSTARWKRPAPRASAASRRTDFFKGLFETALGARRDADRDPRAGRRQGDAHRLCRIGAPARRLRHRRAGGQRARRRQGPRRCAAGLFRRRRHAGARQEGGSRAGEAAMSTRRSPRSTSIRSTTCRRPAPVKQHLAGVLLRRVAKQLMEAR